MSSATGDSKCCHLQKSVAPLKMEVGLRAREEGKGKRAGLLLLLLGKQERTARQLLLPPAAAAAGKTTSSSQPNFSTTAAVGLPVQRLSCSRANARLPAPRQGLYPELEAAPIQFSVETRFLGMLRMMSFSWFLIPPTETRASNRCGRIDSSPSVLNTLDDWITDVPVHHCKGAGQDGL